MVTMPFNGVQADICNLACGVDPEREAMKFKWTCEIEVDETWVADGFELTRERLKDILEHALSYSYSHETACKILGAPDPEDIARVQGYKSAADKAVKVKDKDK